MAKKSNNKKSVTKVTVAKGKVKKTSVSKKKAASIRSKTKEPKNTKILGYTNKTQKKVNEPSVSYNKARLDIRFSQRQKELFEYAATIGGFKTLTAFILQSVELNAEKIIERHIRTLESEKDRAVFFEALTNPAKPNKELTKAVKDFNKLIARK